MNFDCKKEHNSQCSKTNRKFFPLKHLKVQLFSFSSICYYFDLQSILKDAPHRDFFLHLSHFCHILATTFISFFTAFLWYLWILIDFCQLLFLSIFFFFLAQTFIQTRTYTEKQRHETWTIKTETWHVIHIKTWIMFYSIWFDLFIFLFCVTLLAVLVEMCDKNIFGCV